MSGDPFWESPFSAAAAAAGAAAATVGPFAWALAEVSSNSPRGVIFLTSSVNLST